MKLFRTWESPLWRLRLTVEDDALTELIWWDGEERADEHPVFDAAIQALEAFFGGKQPELDFPIRPEGSDFQKAVWREMLRIPYGETLTYGEIADKVGGVARAVGGACGANPIPILIPCHRITGANGKLGGFSGGSGQETKRVLLAHEQSFYHSGLFSSLDG